MTSLIDVLLDPGASNFLFGSSNFSLGEKKMADPVTMKKEFEARRQLRLVDANQFQVAIRTFQTPDDTLQGFRIILRDGDDIEDRNRNGLALVWFQKIGAASRQGSTDIQGLTRLMSGHPNPEEHPDFNGIEPENGKLEIQLHFKQGWRDCATGELQNPEEIALEDGVVSNFG